MNTKLFVGNLPFSTSESELRDMFNEFGGIVNVEVIIDKMTGRSRGFAFVTMESQEAADAAINRLHGQPINGRNLTVNVARPREDRPPRQFSDRGGDRGGDRGDRGPRRERSWGR